MHRSVVGHAAQALGRERPLHRLKIVIERGERKREIDPGRIVVRDLVLVRVAEVPGQVVVVAEDVTGRARGVAVGADRGVVEEAPAARDARRLGVEHRHVVHFAPLLGVDDRNRVVEAGQHVELAPVLVEHHAGRSAAGHRDLVVFVGEERVVFELAAVS